MPGLRVTLGTTVLSQAAGSAAAQVLVDTARVTWGTDDPLAQPDPATAAMTLLDTTLTWAANAGLMGMPVLMEWTPDAALIAAGTTAGRVFFRGRVTGISIDPPTSFTTATGREFRAAPVKLTMTSVELDLASRFVTDGISWPQDTVATRAVRIGSLAGIPVTIRPYWGTPLAVAVPWPELAKTSARDLLLQLYNSTGGDRMVYSPHTQSYEWMGRRRMDTRTLGVMRIDANRGRAGQGAYARARYNFTATGPSTETRNGMWLDGAFLESDDPLEKTFGQRITRSEVTWHDAAAADADRVAINVDPAADESAIGSRSIALDSLHNNGSFAALNGQDLLAMATQEGAAWRPPPVTWDTGKTGGFEHPDQVELSLRGHATGWEVFVNRSYFAVLGVRPAFSLNGGTITYSAGRWIIDYQLAGWATSGGGNASPTLTKQHMVTWEELDSDATTTLVWTDAPAANGLHESLTYEDLSYVGLGLSGSEGADTGWDEYQA
jgi:hypothetical protein